MNQMLVISLLCILGAFGAAVVPAPAGREPGAGEGIVTPTGFDCSQFNSAFDNNQGTCEAAGCWWNAGAVSGGDCLRSGHCAELSAYTSLVTKENCLYYGCDWEDNKLMGGVCKSKPMPDAARIVYATWARDKYQGEVVGGWEEQAKRLTLAAARQTAIAAAGTTILVVAGATTAPAWGTFFIGVGVGAATGELVERASPAVEELYGKAAPAIAEAADSTIDNISGARTLIDGTKFLATSAADSASDGAKRAAEAISDALPETPEMLQPVVQKAQVAKEAISRNAPSTGAVAKGVVSGVCTAAIMMTTGVTPAPATAGKFVADQAASQAAGNAVGLGVKIAEEKPTPRKSLAMATAGYNAFAGKGKEVLPVPKTCDCFDQNESDIPNCPLGEVFKHDTFMACNCPPARSQCLWGDTCEMLGESGTCLPPADIDTRLERMDKINAAMAIPLASAESKPAEWAPPLAEAMKESVDVAEKALRKKKREARRARLEQKQKAELAGSAATLANEQQKKKKKKASEGESDADGESKKKKSAKPRGEVTVGSSGLEHKSFKLLDWICGMILLLGSIIVFTTYTFVFHRKWDEIDVTEALLP